MSSRKLPPPPAAPLMGRAAMLAPTGPARLDNARSVPIVRIRENPQQARQHFDEQALGELAESIRQHGILQPLLLRPDGDDYIIVAGERRWRAATEVGLQVVPAIIREDLDGEAGAAIVTALENLQREDLSVGDEARQYDRLLAALGCSQHELARRLGIHYTRIARLVKILREAPDQLDAIDAGQRTLTGVLGILSAAPPAADAVPAETSYYNGASLFHGETNLQGGSSSASAHGAAGARERTARGDLDPVRSTQIGATFKPPARFVQWAYRLQPTEIAPEDRAELERYLAEAITAAETALRALREGA